MSALTWLFGLGVLTVVFPFLFHLIRRTPKGKTEFSSIMFLSPSPPRLTRRSRLENILLLLLRCGAIALLAFAFMRPFFPDNSQIPLASMPGRKVAVLLDSSASMKRGNLWDDAKKQVVELVRGLSTQDQVSMYTFGSRLNSQNRIGTDGLGTIDRSTLESDLNKLEPNWEASDLGNAISSAAEQLNDLTDESGSKSFSQIYVITDFQKSSNLKSLQSSEWPKNVKVEIVPVESSKTNASILVLQDDDAFARTQDHVRVRIENHRNSQEDQFFVSWQGEEKSEQQLAQYIAPGTSRVIRMPRPDNESSFVSIRGDETEFDNQHFFALPSAEPQTVLYFGDDDPEDAEGMLYYLRHVYESDKTREIKVKKPDELDADEKPALVVVDQEVMDEIATQIDELLNSGILVLFVASDNKIGSSYERWSGGEIVEEEPNRNRRSKYSLLAKIDFQHPLFEVFNDPGLNDFTGIHFWKHTQFNLSESESTKTIAGFDDDHPAVWYREKDGKRMLFFSFGWAPDQSQLALTYKFVPLMFNVMDMAIDAPEPIENCIIGESIQFDNSWTNTSVEKPNGQVATLEGGQPFSETNIPGIYQATSGTSSVRFAVNIDSRESDTEMMTLTQLEALGVELGEQTTAEEKAEQMKSMKDAQLEEQQKIWKWAVIGTLILVMAETVVASLKPSGSANAEDELLEVA